MSSKKSSSLMTSILSGAIVVFGKVSYVVRNDRICAGSECARHNVSVVFVGENDRTFEANPARDRRIFERSVHGDEAVIDLHR
jgi:hypothetical protein